MKGVVFNLLEECVSAEHGEDTWDRLLEAAGLEGSYTSLGSYSDQDLGKLVGAAAEALSLPAEAVVRWFGEAAAPHFARRYPHFFASHHSTRDFLETLNDVIHPEVRKLYPGADVPEFDFDSPAPDVLIMGYQSPRRMCSFAEGLIVGAAKHFNEEVDITQTSCMLKGADKCVLRITFRRAVP